MTLATFKICLTCKKEFKPFFRRKGKVIFFNPRIKCHYKITFGREMPNNIKTWGMGYKLAERRLN